MNLKNQLAALTLACNAVTLCLHAQITSIPYADGSDGVLNVTSNTVIDLSQAITGGWTSSNTIANAGKGIYDPTNWAVVFKYSSVNIASGANLSFSNHLTHAPVVWLIGSNGIPGNVVINGAIGLDGQSWTYDQNNLPEPGPGGFRGGGYSTSPGTDGSGFGPGGGLSGYNPPAYNGTYGNSQLIPLIGGSGGSGYGSDGGAGGGAILIATAGNINLTNGALHANGGIGHNNWNSGGGGAIRLVANQISGNGGTVIQVAGGYSLTPGIIRLEANEVVGFNPPIQAVVPSNTPAIFQDASFASVSVLSISNQTAYLPAPSNPKATMNANPDSDDFTMVTTNAATIRLQTVNFPTNGTVTVYIKPRTSIQTMTNATCISSNNGVAIWQVNNVNLLYPGHTIIQAHATY